MYVSAEIASWEAWLVSNPNFSLSGRDNDEVDVDVDEDDVDEDADSSGADDGEDDDSDGDGEDDGENADLERLKRQNKRLQKQIDSLTELLSKKADKQGDEDGAPEGYVSQEDYDSLFEILRTDFVENAISSFKNKDGSQRWAWEDPSAVYRFLDVDELEFDLSSRTIDGLEDQLKDIAARYPFMLKGNGKPGARNGGKIGSKPGKPGTREEKKDLTKDALVEDFPALVN